MKYAKEVIDLLAAYPGRRFKMRHIVNHVAPRAEGSDRVRVRVGVWRALAALREAGTIGCQEAGCNGAHAEYWWENAKSVTSSSGKPLRKASQLRRAIAP